MSLAQDRSLVSDQTPPLVALTNENKLGGQRFIETRPECPDKRSRSNTLFKYPLYQKGGPQLRVFLPNFWMKLVRPPHNQPPNIVLFSCSMEMTKFDVKNYMEKIYNVKCVDIRTRIHMPKTRRERTQGYVIKDDDIKYAYVTLPKGEEFKFPELFDTSVSTEKEDHDKSLKQAKEGYQEFLSKNKERQGMPGWFTI